MSLLNILVKSYFEYFIKNTMFYLQPIHIDILDNASDICYEDSVLTLLKDEGYLNYKILFKYYCKYAYTFLPALL